LHIWTDLAFIEVVDPETYAPVAPGEPGALVVTSLFGNNCTPFLRWFSGDIDSYQEEGSSDSPLSIFPVIRHAHRTAGFFKIRGVNITHAELEDLMFEDAAIGDFKAAAVNDGGLDDLRLSIETAKGQDAEQVAAEVSQKVKNVFEVTPVIEQLPVGTLAREFETSVKAPRFADLRE
jgi:phenylacetate-CoA ligase